jgi:DNA-directed RNA polymerase subunit M/transcription elongation factor TFIIS
MDSKVKCPQCQFTNVFFITKSPKRRDKPWQRKRPYAAFQCARCSHVFRIRL